MITLADLSHLPRPGGGVATTRCRELFWASPLIRNLRWPVEVAEQFLFDHGTKEEFTEQYGHLDLSALSWRCERLAAEEIAAATVFPRFQRWTLQVESNPHFFIGMRPERQRAWAEAGSWVVPPVLIDGSLLSSPRTGLHLVEGHTRVGTIRGLLLREEIAARSRHAVYVGVSR